MGSRKMVPMNLFEGQQWKQRNSRFVDTVGEGSWKHALPRVKQIAIGICCMPQGAQPGAP